MSCLSALSDFRIILGKLGYIGYSFDVMGGSIER